MSNVYQPKRKELAKVKVISTEYYRNNRSKFNFIGSVQRGYTAFITTQKNTKTGKRSFVDDTSSLTKRAKNDIVHFFSDQDNRNKGVAYLVLPKTATQKTSISKNKSKKVNPYNDFSYTSTGRIKGSYNVDGFFEPD